jgi:hypothetical protein
VDQIPLAYQRPAENYEGRTGIFSTVPSSPASGSVPTAELAARLEAVCYQLTTAFAAVRSGAGDYDLDSIEVLLDVTASGEVRLVGSAKAPAPGGGLRLKFQRRAA